MGLFEKLQKGEDYKWIWYIGTLFGSFVPVIFRLIASMDHSIPAFDIKDLLFAGLAMNLSNLNLIGSKDFEFKIPIALLSFVFIVVIAVVLGITFTDEAVKSPKPIFSGISICSLVFVIATIYLSFEANNYVFSRQTN